MKKLSVLTLFILGLTPLAYSNPCVRNPASCKSSGPYTSEGFVFESISDLQTKIRVVQQDLQYLERTAKDLVNKRNKNLASIKKVKKHLEQCQAAKKIPRL